MMFSSLPPEIQMIILKHVDRSSLFSLCLVNKHLYQLSIMEVHSIVDLFCHEEDSGWCGNAMMDAMDAVTTRQDQYYSTIQAHPGLAAATQTLLWQTSDRIWDILALMPGLRHLQLDGIPRTRNLASTCLAGKHPGPPSAQPECLPWSTFSCLETVLASGNYAAGALSGILVSSPRLQKLSLTGGVTEYPINGEGRASVVPVLDACVLLPQGLPNLQWLELERYVFINNQAVVEPEGPALQAWSRFLSRFGGQLEHLTLRLEKYELQVKFEPEIAFRQHILPLFTSRIFTALKYLSLRGFEPTAQDEAALRKGLPSDATIVKIPKEEFSSMWD